LGIFYFSVSINNDDDDNHHHIYYKYKYSLWSRKSVVGIATGYGLDDREVGVRVPVRLRIFSSPRRRDRLWALSLGVNRPGREAGHSPPTGAEIKKMWSYTSTPPDTFIA
jgi:hypothetical protein